MESVATLLRSLQLFAHRAHHDIQGATFFEDHKFLGKLYPAYEEAYDAVVERIIGKGGKPNLAKLNETAAKNAALQPDQHAPNVLFSVILESEKTLCEIAAKATKDASEGTRNLLAQICDDSEKRQFLIQKRLTK